MRIKYEVNSSKEDALISPGSVKSSSIKNDDVVKRMNRHLREAARLRMLSYSWLGTVTLAPYLLLCGNPKISTLLYLTFYISSMLAFLSRWNVRKAMKSIADLTSEYEWVDKTSYLLDKYPDHTAWNRLLRFDIEKKLIY